MAQVTKIEWRAIPSAPGYEVSTDGQIRSSRCVMRQQVAKGGYLYVYVYSGGRQTMRKVWAHIAVLEAFVGSAPEGEETRHLDGDPTHNTVGNLAWGTPLENAADKARHGTQPRGEQSASAKLSEADVLEIRRLHGTVSLRKLGERFGVSHTAIRRAATGAKWSHI